MVHAFEGNKAETTTIVPAVQAFAAAHQLTEVTVVADAGMVSAGNQKAIEDAGLSFILGARIPYVPYVVAQWRRDHPGQEIPDGHVFTQPWPAWRGAEPPRPGHLLPLQGRPGPADPARHRRAGRQSRESPRRRHAGQAEPVRPAHRRDQEREPGPGSQGQSPGRG